MEKIIKRILDKIDQLGLLEQLSGLPPSDLNSLFLAISKTHTDKLAPTDILKSYRSNRFVTPSALDPARVYQFAADLTRKAKAAGIEPVLLSPVAPLGSCSAFGCVDQNNVVSATRNCEVLSDPSNTLAIYLADKIGSGAIDNRNGVHVCSVDRVIRAQVFKGAGFFAHFGVFCIVSAGKDTGSYACKVGLLTKQLSFYREFFKAGYDAEMAVVLRKRGGYTDTDGFFARMLHLMQLQLPDIPITTDESNVGNNYYKGINYKMYLRTKNGSVEVGDGGFTDWTQRMLGNKKERCLISGLGIDRLLLIE